MKKFILATVATLALTATAQAEQVELVKFVCNNQYAVPSVAHDTDLIIGLSPLPGGCEWVQPVAYGTIGEMVHSFPLSHGKVGTVNPVTVGDLEGYTAGVIELLG